MLTDLQKEYESLTAAVKVMKSTAIELRSKGGEPSNNFKKLLCEKAARLKEENNMQIADDGFTQTVTVRKGIAIKGNKAVNPIVKLKPYRTFLEIEQPESEFLIRLFEGGYAALFEADGGAWKLNARNAIQDYLSKNLSELVESGIVIITA